MTSTISSNQKKTIVGSLAIIGVGMQGCGSDPKPGQCNPMDLFDVASVCTKKQPSRSKQVRRIFAVFAKILVKICRIFMQNQIFCQRNFVFGKVAKLGFRV